jgi:DNA-binding winged helix-turn-helix (wHTH) protein/Tol biopolymer transport system component
MMANKSLFFSFEDVEVREREFSIIKAGEVVQIEPKAFRVLLIFLRNPRKLLTKEELLNAVWGDTVVTENSLTRAIALLRRLLDDDSRTPRYIETVSSVGYRFICPVEVGEDSSVICDPATAVKNGDVEGVAERAMVRTSPRPLAKSRWMWVLAAGAAAIILLAGGIWYLSRPLPPPTITAYTQITHDGRSKTLAGTDGSRLYFTQISPNLIAEVGINGGEIAYLPIAIPAINFTLRDISPDASRLLITTFEAGHPVSRQWLVPMLGGAAKRLEDGGGSTFSPDGGSVIYSSLNGDIFISRTDGTGKYKLASVGSEANAFSWSPDGKVIRFSKPDGLWEMSKDGAEPHRLIPGWKEGALQCCGRWVDGSLYVFLTDGQIWALDERRGLIRHGSSVPTQLTSGPIRWSSPIPGRDGKTIFAVGANRRGELSRIDVKTGISQPFLGGISAEFVSFSPDGKSLAYAAFPEGTLWKTDRDGSNRMQLTQPGDTVINPRWSPDSKEIVFETMSPNLRHQSIHRVSAADGSPLWLMSEESGDMNDANWSPDGTKVLFGRGLGAGFAPGKRDLRIVDLKSRQVTILPGSDDMWSPRWSPDGRYVLAFRGVVGLQLFDFATQKWGILPHDGDTEYFSFSRDGRFVYFMRDGPGKGLYRIPVAGGKEVRLVDMTDWHMTGVFGPWMSLDPSGAPLVLRDTGSIDIYALTLKEK